MYVFFTCYVVALWPNIFLAPSSIQLNAISLACVNIRQVETEIMITSEKNSTPVLRPVFEYVGLGDLK